jgi:hypothetical protein
MAEATSPLGLWDITLGIGENLFLRMRSGRSALGAFCLGCEPFAIEHLDIGGKNQFWSGVLALA